MKRFLRTLLKAVGIAVPALHGDGAGAIEPSFQVERDAKPSVTTLVRGLSDDPALRARFAANPHAVFREMGLNAAPYRLPDRLDEAEVGRFLAAWTGPSGPAVGESGQTAAPAADLMSMSGPVAVYGPPPAPGPTPPKQREKVAPPPEPEPSVPVPDKSPPPPPVPLHGPTPEPEPVPPHSPAPVYGPPPGLPRR